MTMILIHESMHVLVNLKWIFDGKSHSKPPFFDKTGCHDGSKDRPHGRVLGVHICGVQV